MNESNKILKEIQEKHGVDENMILYCIKYQQESDFGIYFFFIAKFRNNILTDMFF
jgi:hypothetical protein